jgi:dihydroorotate dehydrogenase
VQLYSALVYHGPNLATKINRELIVLVKKDGFSNITEAIGIDHK